MLPQFYYKPGTPSNLSCIPIISNICSTYSFKPENLQQMRSYLKILTTDYTNPEYQAYLRKKIETILPNYVNQNTLL